jgi:hypothetical protein
MQSLAVVEDLDVAGDGFECGAQVADLGGQPGQGAAPAWRTRCSPMTARICGFAVEGGPIRSRVRRPQ